MNDFHTVFHVDVNDAHTNEKGRVPSMRFSNAGQSQFGLPECVWNSGTVIVGTFFECQQALTASMMHSKSSDAPTRLVVFLGHRTSDEAPDAVPSGQYDPTGHLFWKRYCATRVTEIGVGQTTSSFEPTSLQP